MYDPQAGEVTLVVELYGTLVVGFIDGENDPAKTTACELAAEPEGELGLEVAGGSCEPGPAWRRDSIQKTDRSAARGT